MTLTFSASLTEIYEYPSFDSANADGEVNSGSSSWKKEEATSELRTNSSISLKNGGKFFYIHCLDLVRERIERAWFLAAILTISRNIS